MTCAAYTDSRLAALYDALNPPEADTAFYLDLAGTSPKRVLDVGCGTGRLASELAGRGHRVIGADPSPAMLAIARSRPGGGRVTWIESGAAGLRLPEPVDLAVMTGHVFQVFLEDSAVAAALTALRALLAPGGRLAFETRNPPARGWESWRPDATREILEVEGQGPVAVHYDVTAVEGELVSYETQFDFGPGDRVVAPSRLRFMPQDTLARQLAEAGFESLLWYGDWDRSPLTARSPEIIVVAR